MDDEQIRTVANELLGLGLSLDEAASLAGPLAGLRRLIELVERVPLPFSALPFTTPQTGDHWLDQWPDPAEKSAAPQ